jgi:hypothetical protein
MKMLTGNTTKSRTQCTPEAIVNNEAKLLSAFSAGDVSHQGDLIIVGISRLPKSATPRKSRQLAEGNTQGARHVLARGEVYFADPSEVAELIDEATKCRVKPTYIGPVFVSPAKPTADDLTHPEHGNQGFPAGQVCAVVYQRTVYTEVLEQMAREREERAQREREERVRD